MRLVRGDEAGGKLVLPLHPDPGPPAPPLRNTPYISNIAFKKKILFVVTAFEVLRNNTGIERSEHAHVRTRVNQPARRRALLLNTRIHLLSLNIGLAITYNTRQQFSI